MSEHVVTHHTIAVLVQLAEVVPGDAHAALDRANAFGAEIAASVPNAAFTDVYTRGLTSLEAALAQAHLDDYNAARKSTRS